MKNKKNERQISLNEIAIITAVVAFVLTAYRLENPPEFISILAAILPVSGFAGALGFVLKGRRRACSFALFGSLLWTAILLPLIRFPVSADITVPYQYRHEVDQLVKDLNLPVIRHPHVWFNCLHYDSKPNLAWKVWLSQKELLDDASAKGYFCEVKYTPIVNAFSWSRSAGDSAMVGLQ